MGEQFRIQPPFAKASASGGGAKRSDTPRFTRLALAGSGAFAALRRRAPFRLAPSRGPRRTARFDPDAPL